MTVRFSLLATSLVRKESLGGGGGRGFQGANSQYIM